MSGEWQCSKKAANAMLGLVDGQPVTREKRDTDRYGRIIATCTAGDTDVGQAMVERGCACAYRRFSDEYASEQDAARAAGLGIWQRDNQPPSEFRDRSWQAALKLTPREGCPIKGNISDSGQIYHTLWYPWHGWTKINEAKGERWFCDELEAVQEGWRAPYWP